jgi:hypothetical protein
VDGRAKGFIVTRERFFDDKICGALLAWARGRIERLGGGARRRRELQRVAWPLFRPGPGHRGNIHPTHHPAPNIRQEHCCYRQHGQGDESRLAEGNHFPVRQFFHCSKKNKKRQQKTKTKKKMSRDDSGDEEGSAASSSSALSLALLSDGRLAASPEDPPPPFLSYPRALRITSGSASAEALLASMRSVYATSASFFIMAEWVVFFFFFFFFSFFL